MLREGDGDSFSARQWPSDPVHRGGSLHPHAGRERDRDRERHVYERETERHRGGGGGRYGEILGELGRQGGFANLLVTA